MILLFMLPVASNGKPKVYPRKFDTMSMKVIIKCPVRAKDKKIGEWKKDGVSESHPTHFTPIVEMSTLTRYKRDIKRTARATIKAFHKNFANLISMTE